MKRCRFPLLLVLPMLSGCLPHYADSFLYNQSGRTVSVQGFSEAGPRVIDSSLQNGERILIPPGPYGEQIDLQDGTNVYRYPDFALVPCEGRSAGLRTTVYDFTLLSDMTIMPGAAKDGHGERIRPDVWRSFFWLDVRQGCSEI